MLSPSPSCASQGYHPPHPPHPRTGCESSVPRRSLSLFSTIHTPEPSRLRSLPMPPLFPFPISTIRLILQCDPCEFEPLLSASTCATWLHGVQLPRLIVVTPASLLQPCPDSMASQLGVNTNSHLVLLPPPHPPRTISPAALQHHPYPHAGQIYCCQTPVTPPCLPAVTPDSLPNLPHLPHLPHPCHTYGSSATHYHTTCLQPLSPR